MGYIKKKTVKKSCIKHFIDYNMSRYIIGKTPIHMSVRIYMYNRKRLIRIPF